MDNEEVIQKVARYIENKFKDEGAGHDWWHIYRVWKMAAHIGTKEGGNFLVINLGALLHDIDDPKISGHDKPAEKIKLLLSKYVDNQTINSVIDIVETISFRNSFANINTQTLEGKIVQDADRLDAIGAIGIARAFAYGGSKQRLMYDPANPPQKYQSKEDYVKSDTSSINHFYEKLLLLKDKMNTKTAKKIAKERHDFMEKYLDRFYKEWEGTS